MKSITFCLLIGALLSQTASNAQPGCTDAQANNFNASATSNDGSCTYPVTNYIPVFKASLPNELREVSGLTQAGPRWWAHNDSGFDPTFFSVNPENGNILQEVKLKNAHNRDWEDASAGGQYLFIGDFGNNTNDRHDLGMYKIPLSAIGNSNSETVQDDEWVFLPFAYADQTDFTPQPADSTVFDCEAMIFLGGKLHVFTKNRRDYTTAHYVVTEGSGIAEKVETFNSNLLITGAALSPDGKLIVLLGYDLRPFIPTVACWLLWDWQPGTQQFFSGNKRRIELGLSLQVGQAESIAFSGNRRGYLSNERTVFNGLTVVPESIRTFDFETWVPETVGAAEPAEELLRGSIFPNPVSNNLHFQFSGKEKPEFFCLKNQLEQVVMQWNEIPETAEVAALPAGCYTAQMRWRDGGWQCWKIIKI